MLFTATLNSFDVIFILMAGVRLSDLLTRLVNLIPAVVVVCLFSSEESVRFKVVSSVANCQL